MKRLFLLRHAKSSWKEPSLTDIDRPLNKRGRTAAQMMAKYMASEGLVPELTLCSPSLRTRETLAYLGPSVAGQGEIRIDERLYHASREQILKCIAAADSDIRKLLVIGHNPGLDELARSLSLRGDLATRRRLREKFPTGALAVIELAGEQWRTLSEDGARLERFVRPKDLYSAPSRAFGMS